MELPRRSVCLVALLACLACNRRHTPQAGAESAPSHEHVLWRGEEVGLELFANGDFELAISPASAPKFLVLGRARTSAGAEPMFDLDVTRIWRARYVDDARKENRPGELADAAEALGHRFERGKTARLHVRASDGGSFELCAEACARVEKRTPALAGEWRRKGEPEPGALLRLDLDRHNVRLEMHHDRGAGEVWSGIDATSTGPDRFRLTLPAEHDAGPHTFDLRRLPNETLEVCDGPKCNVFERYFNAYRYDVRP